MAPASRPPGTTDAHRPTADTDRPSADIQGPAADGHGAASDRAAGDRAAADGHGPAAENHGSETDPHAAPAGIEDRGSFTHGTCGHCGWSGPGRRARSVAARDAVRHLQAGCAERVASTAARPDAAHPDAAH
jgi:hypothetical protein